MSQYPPQFSHDPQSPSNSQWPPQPPSQPLTPGYPPPYSPMPPQQPFPPAQPGYPQPGQQMPPPPFPPQPPKRKNWIRRHPVLTTVAVIFFIVVGVASQLTNGTNNNTAASSTPAAHPSPTTAVSPTATPRPTPTPKPKPTPTPKPTQSPAQIEQVYKSSATDTDVATLDKDGNTDQNGVVHFTATLVAFVKDDSGNTAGANVTDSTDSAFVQVVFPAGTDVSQLNAQDTIEVWGIDLGTQSGTNAFGATVQEVAVQAQYMTDQATGYQAG